ncbi:MAG TPA: SOS response-associated peptidase [Chloroflexota bacterium]
MCGRFGLEQPEFSEVRFKAQPLPETQPLLIARYNIAPTQDVLTVACSKRLHGERALKSMRWGLTASWALGDPSKPKPINIKSEGILDRPQYRHLLSRKRCLIAADGFYEWRRMGGRAKQPYWISLRNGPLFAFAGIWDACKVGDEWLVSCAILTTTPNALVADLHDRMPVILQPEDEALWLDPELTDPGELLPLLQPLPKERMAIFPVSPLVNDVRNEGPELRRHAAAEQLAFL